LVGFAEQFKPWESLHSLVEECKQDDMDVLFVTHIDAKPGESIEFTGGVY